MKGKKQHKLYVHTTELKKISYHTAISLLVCWIRLPAETDCSILADFGSEYYCIAVCLQQKKSDFT